MIEKDINNFKINHDELKRCNLILDDNWTDRSAEQFKTTYLRPIEAAGTTFVGESLVHAQELRRSMEELEELELRFRQLSNELSDICSHPSWDGCGIGVVEGHDELNSQLSGQEFFVVPKDKMRYINERDVMTRLAMLQITTQDEFCNPRFYSSV